MDGTDGGDRVLAVGDLVAVIAVVAIGRVSHYGFAGLADLLTTAETIAPFVLGYAIAALLADAYDERALTSLGWSVRIGGVVAIAGANLGLLLRGLPLLAGGVAWPFPLVLTGTLLAVVVGWRAVFVTLWG